MTARRSALERAGFVDITHTRYRLDIVLDAQRARELYATFSEMQLLPEERRERLLDEVASTVDRDFGGEVTRPAIVALYVARAP